jgi:class 3 adenylate cyclase
MTPRTQYADVDGHSVAYQVFGEGEHELVYVWGTLSHLDWYWSDPDVTHALRRAAARAKLLMYDHTGVGLSDPVPYVPTVEERAAELAALIDEVGFHRPHIVGIVDGCAPAVYLAATQPEKIGRLELLSPWLSGPGDQPWCLPQRAHDQWVDIVHHWGEGRSLDLLFPSMSASPFHRRLWGTYERSAMSRGTALQLIDVNRFLDVTPLLGAIQTPTLVMHNRNDPVIPFEGALAIADAIPDATLVELEGEDVGVAYNRDVDEAVDRSLEFLIGAGPVIDADRAYLTVMFTDIVSSTDKIAEVGDAAWQGMLSDVTRATRDIFGTHGGTEIGRLGDGFVATYPGPTAAVAAGAALIERIAAIGLSLRVGLHSGEVQLLGDEPTGMAMHVAARVCALANGGQVLVSDATRNLLDNAAVHTVSAGAHVLKGVPGRHVLYDAKLALRPDLPRQRKELTLQDRIVGQSVRRAPGMSRALIRLSRRAVAAS